MLTPAMQQYYDIKTQNPDCVVFFRMGDFYEMFGDDAHIAHKVLGINVTSRNKNAANPEALAGFPYHAKDKYLPLLLEAGYKVAIVEQVSDPKLKGIVKREVVRIVTPTTLHLEGDGFDDSTFADCMIAISKIDDFYGVSVLYISNGDWKTTQFGNFETLAGELYKLSPKEVILEKQFFQDEKMKEILNKKYGLNVFYSENNFGGEKYLKNHFGVSSLTGFGIEKLPAGISASALLLGYLENNQKQSLKMLDSIGLYSSGKYMEIDPSTLRSLDILYNFSTNSETLGTLFGVLNQTQTSMGKRNLKHILVRPLKEKAEIEKRQKFVEIFAQNTILLDKTRLQLKFIADLDAILNRLSLGRMTPRDLLALKRSFQSVLDIQKLLGDSQYKELHDFFNH